MIACIFGTVSRSTGFSGLDNRMWFTWCSLVVLLGKDNMGDKGMSEAICSYILLYPLCNSLLLFGQWHYMK